MPGRSKKPCSYPRCPNLSEGRYCEKHRQEKSNGVSDKFYDRHLRNKKATAFYKSSAWRKIRVVALAKDNHLCVECLKNKRLTPAKVVDHVIPIRVEWDKRLDLDNLQSLCHSCHNKKTARE